MDSINNVIEKCELKNIIIVYDYAFINGGAAQVAIQSAISLAKVGFKVHYFSAVGPICDELLTSDVDVFCSNIQDINNEKKIKAIKDGIWNNKVKNDFANYISSFDLCDTIIHVHGWTKALSVSAISVALKRKYRVLITLHDYFSVCPNGGFYNYQRDMVCNKKPMSFSCITCNCDKRSFSQKIWRVFRQLVQDKYIKNNPNIEFISISQLNEDMVKRFVASNDFCRINNPLRLADKKIEDCSKSNVLLYVGRLSNEKGTELFCEAVSNIKQKGLNVEGFVVGDGVLHDFLKEKYSLLHFEGWKKTEEVKDYIQKARCLVFPSKWIEGAPLTIVEAMSASLPCIVSDCTSAVELVEDGVNGFVFESMNIDSLEDKIMCALNDNIIHEIQNNIKLYFVNDDYSEKKHTSNLLERYLISLSIQQLR